MVNCRCVPLLFVLGLSACGLGRQYQNAPLQPALVQSLQPGKTTAAEATTRLGAPTEVVQLGRRTAYRYDATGQKIAVMLLGIVNIGNLDARSDRLWLFFDEQDVLSHYGVTYGMEQTRYAMPWQELHPTAAGELGK